MTPARIGRYEIVEELGRGAMGVVYRARDERLGRDVAVKLLLGFDPEDRLRFERELKALSAAAHPNVVRVLDAGADHGRPFLVQELVSGGSLAERLRREGPLPCTEAAQIVRKLCRGLAAAHAVGVLHRDLKPDNVLLSAEGEPLLADFGLARRLAGGERLTATGTVMGTPAYMSPEQAMGEGERVGPASDVYGLGAILYALLTGQPPYSGRSVIETLTAVVSDPLRPPSELRPGIPPALEAACSRALERLPEDRFADALAFQAALEPVKAATARKPPPWPLLAFAGLTIAAGVGVALGLRSPQRDERSEASPTPTPAPDPGKAAHQALLRRAMAELKAWRPSAALPLIHEALELAPRDPEARTLQANALLALDQPSRAQEVALDVLKGHPTHEEASGALASAYLLLNQLTESEEVARRIAREHPQQATGHFLLAQVHALRDQPKQALESLERIVPDQWTDRVLVLHARTLRQLGRPEEGLRSAERVGLRFPPGYYARALCLRSLKRHAEALRALDTYAELEPRPIDPWRLRVDCLLDLKRFDQAERVTDQQLEAHPDDPHLLGRKALLLNQKKEFAEALRLARRALKQKPQRASWRRDALDSIAVSLNGLERYQEAQATYQRLLRRFGDQKRWRLRRSYALNELGRRAEALHELDAILAKEPEDAGVLRTRANLRGEVGRLAEGLADHDRVVKLRPASVEAKTDRALYMYRFRYQEGRGLEQLRALARAEPKQALVEYLLACFLVRRPEPSLGAEGRERLKRIAQGGGEFASRAKALLESKTPGR